MFRLDTNLTPSLYNVEEGEVDNTLRRIIQWMHSGPHYALPEHLRRPPNLPVITVGELRKCGMPIPLLIPDEGDIPCGAVHADKVRDVREDGVTYEIYSVAFTAAFQWRDATGHDAAAQLSTLYYKKRAP